MSNSGSAAGKLRPKPADPAARKHAERAVKDPVRVHDERSLSQAAEAWHQAEVLGLDTEFVRERTYYARPGLVQISDGITVWLVDVVAMEGLPMLRQELAQLLDHEACTKILHATGEDLEVLDQLSGTLPRPLFDTQIAAAMLGAPLQCRLEHLVEMVAGVELPGGQARNNWRRRPLPEALEVYAAQDVIWLPALRAALVEDLEHSRRLGWLEEDCRRMVDSYGRRPPAWLRIKGAARLPDQALPRLKALAEWRERQAIERDLPRSFVLKDPLLLTLARKAPPDMAALARIEGIPGGLLRRHGGRLLECLAETPDSGFHRPPELIDLDSAQQEVLGKLQDQVRRAADTLGMDPALIASRRELTRLLQGGPAGWLDGWRGEVLGAEFADALRAAAGSRS